MRGLRKGMTLVELAIATVVIAIIVDFLIYFLAATSRSSRHAFEAASAMQSFLRVEELLRQDLDRAFSTPAGALAVVGDGRGASLSFPIRTGLDRVPVRVSFQIDQATVRLSRQAPGAPARAVSLSVDRLSLTGVREASSGLTDLVFATADRALPGLSPRGPGADPGSRAVFFATFGLRHQALLRAYPWAVSTRVAILSSPPGAGTTSPAAETVVDLEGGDREERSSLTPPMAGQPAAATIVGELQGLGLGKAIPSMEAPALKTRLAQVARSRVELSSRLVHLERAVTDLAGLSAAGADRAFVVPVLEYLRQERVLSAPEVRSALTASDPNGALLKLRGAIEAGRDQERQLGVLEQRLREALEAQTRRPAGSGTAPR
ncbi:MAG: prepilin-type N-terminal cleavage/methylation domain-containing protein [Candidatus Riflebacteria bacterium]|nr:prepilin-type N-terminal cleavage/methylation domain-containing protein [Candidatus Riflebacteria bacterium]